MVPVADRPDRHREMLKRGGREPGPSSCAGLCPAGPAGQGRYAAFVPARPLCGPDEVFGKKTGQKPHVAASVP